MNQKSMEQTNMSVIFNLVEGIIKINMHMYVI